MARPRSIVEMLYHPKVVTAFEPFQAMRLLEQIANDREDGTRPENWIPVEQAFRYRMQVTLGRPSSNIAQIIPPMEDDRKVENVDEKEFRSAQLIREAYVRRHHLDRPGAKWRQRPNFISTFFGLFGTQGALPILYTEKLLELLKDTSTRPTRTAFRDWLDLFNHRLGLLLFRAWEKYRFTVPHVRSTWRRPGDELQPATDRFSAAMYSMVGIGTPPLRDRIAVFPPAARRDENVKPLTRVDDRVLLRYLGSFARRRGGSYELRVILEEYFGITCQVQELVGQWLAIPATSQTTLETSDDDCRALGVNAVAGERVWDFGSRFRLVIGPLSYTDFVEFLPDPTPVPERKAIYLLAQLTRLYVGMELDFDIQLILDEASVPEPWMMDLDESKMGLRLGWNIWMKGEDGLGRDADDLIFDAPCEPILN